MNDRIRRLYEMLLRVNDFMSANTADFSGVAFVAATAATLQTETARIGALAASKVQNTAAAKDSTVSRAESRSDLRSAMEDIAAVWKSAAAETGEAANKFRMPRGNSDQNLVATAKTFAIEAEANKPFFLDRGLTPAFVTELQAKTAAFEQAIITAEASRRERVGTNASFEEPLKNARNAVRNLEPIVKRTYRSNPQKMAQWMAASRVERQAKSMKPALAPVS